MKTKYDSLFEFENDRKLENYIPPTESTTFYSIGNGIINIYTNENGRFDLNSQRNEFNIGDTFTVGNNSNYDSFTIIENTKVNVNNELIIDNGVFSIHGNLNLNDKCKLIIKNNSKVIFYGDSSFIIGANTILDVDETSKVEFYGDIHCHVYSVDSMYSNTNIHIDSAAVMIVTGLDLLGKRIKSLIEYDVELRNKDLKQYSQGEINTPSGKIGYKCLKRNESIDYQLIDINILYGEAVLGDFKYQILGRPDNDIKGLQVVNNLKVDKRATLYITDNYKGYKYIYPNLYIGVILNDNDNSHGATLEIDGSVIVDGNKSIINVDRGCIIKINEGGELWLKNNATILSTHNEHNNVLIINGTLYIESIEQIETFENDNIRIGEEGKVIILNNNHTSRTVLLSIPNGIQESTLYRLFRNRLDKVEYHIQKDTGIRIDEYFKHYYLYMTDWYNGHRLEKAINEGMIIWHDGGFIDLIEDITEWSNENCTLLDLPKLFKGSGNTDIDKLQDIVNKLKYVGCGDIIFRFIGKRNYTDIRLCMDDIKLSSLVRYPDNDLYHITTTADGKLFLRNNVTNITTNSIINKNSKVLDIINNNLIFNIE